MEKFRQRSTVPDEAEDVDWDAPPPYELFVGDDNCNVSTAVQGNGRISMQFRGRNPLLESLPPMPPLPEYEPSIPESQSFATTTRSYPLINIVIQVVGSRGDVQPFVALGQELKTAGHRVRIATHDTFKDFVQSSGLEFFPIGGDPADLMAYMVKNPGIIPKMDTIRKGDIARKRKMIREMLEGCWRSCIDPDPVTNIPFVAEAIIANPPSFAHVHCAQAMGIPLHLMFTMPWTATRAFPHPLANIQPSDADPKMINFLSYGLVEMMTWQGLGDVINQWRKTSLNLDAVPAMFESNLIATRKIPFTYCWSPALVPKPFDWPSNIDVCGFFFRNAPEYTPFPELDAFLRAGPPPIYIGFGSIVMENAAQMTQTIVDAVHECGVRAIVSKGWSKLGTGVENDKILFIDDCPHEWLFKHVAAVIHHGGAGTTACGLLNGRPTAIVPFFGDQPFWGNMVAVAKAGPPPIDHKFLDTRALSSAITFLLSPDTRIAAAGIAEKMRHENGVKAAVASFHRNLSVPTMSCDLIKGHPATWIWKKGEHRTLNLSHKAAAILVEEKKIDSSALKLYKSKPIQIQNQRWDPITATTSAFFDSVKNVSSAVGDLVESPVKEYRRARTLERESTGLSARSGESVTSGEGTVVRGGESVWGASSVRGGGSEWGGESVRHADTVAIRGGELTPRVDSARSVHSGSSDQTVQTKHSSASRAAGKAVGRGFGKVGNAIFKTAVDLPVAVADGFHAAPKLYGGKVRELGDVNDWKSGSKVGGKNLAMGFYDGYAGFFTEPYKGVRDHGPLGIVTGLIKGCGGLLTQPAAAMFGIVAYPALGLYRSLNTSHVKGAQGEILKSQQLYGTFLLETNPPQKADIDKVVNDFDAKSSGYRY